MSFDSIVIDRREFIRKATEAGILLTATIATISDKMPLPKIQLDWGRSIGDTALPIPTHWYRDFDRVGINSNPLDKATIESIPMTDIDCKKWCKSNPGFDIQTVKFGMSMPNFFKELERDFKAKPGQLVLVSNDWYAIVPSEPENTFFSASKNNIPERMWNGSGYEEAVKAKLTPYGTFIPYGSEAKFAWKDVVDLRDIRIIEKEMPPGDYFIGPDNKIIQPENHDISMSLDNLVLEIAGREIHYKDIKEVAEKNSFEYRKKQVPSISLNALLKSFELNPEEHALILYANKYIASIPPWRQDNLRIIFDEKYEKRYGVPTKLIGDDFLNKAAHIGGFYKIEAVPMEFNP